MQDLEGNIPLHQNEKSGDAAYSSQPPMNAAVINDPHEQNTLDEPVSVTLVS